METRIQTPMAQGRSTKTSSMIKWIWKSRLSITNYLSGMVFRVPGEKAAATACFGAHVHDQFVDEHHIHLAAPAGASGFDPPSEPCRGNKTRLLASLLRVRLVGVPLHNSGPSSPKPSHCTRLSRLSTISCFPAPSRSLHKNWPRWQV